MPQALIAGHRPRPHRPDPACLKQGIPYQAGGRHGSGQAGPAVL